MGKQVLVVDLNPLSRSSRRGTVTIVDELSRVTKNMIQLIPEKPQPTDWDNNKSLQASLNHISKNLENRFD